jgi:hypothetical protein
MRAPRLALLSALLSTGLAVAQDEPPPCRPGAAPFTADQRLLLSEGVLRGSPRMMGIAGAFVGIAEGAEGIPRNPAAAAAKSTTFDSDFSVDFGGTLHLIPPWLETDQDWDNDGCPDQVEPPGAEVLSLLGTQVLYSAVSFRYKNVGLGLGFDLQNFFARPDSRTFLNLNQAHLFGSFAAALWEDQILLGLGVESTHAFLVHLTRPEGGGLPSPDDSLGYHGWGIQFAGVWRPKDENYRVGFAFRPPTTAYPTAQRQRLPEVPTGFIPFSQIVAPARLSIGASWAIGSTGRNYNITGPEGWAVMPEKDAEGRPKTSAALTRWLVTTQLDVLFAVDNATTAVAFFEQRSGVSTQRAGNQATFLPRAALEKELIENWLRLRLGGYLEPPLVDSAPVIRPHLTFGGEVALFRLGSTRVAFGLSFDLAHRYQNLSVAFLAWK